MSFYLLKQSLSPHLRVQNYEKNYPLIQIYLQKIYQKSTK